MPVALRVLGIILLAGTGSSLPAQQAQNVAGAVLRGMVVAADTGLPIRDAAVLLERLEQPIRRDDGQSRPGGSVPTRRTVDVQGRFEFTGVGPGRYRILVIPGAAAAQYLPGRFPEAETDGTTSLVLSGIDVVNGVELRLSRAAVIFGRVVDEHGSPLANVAVSAIRFLAGDRQGRAPGLGSRTDDTGSFRVFGLAAGEYLLHAQPGMSPLHPTTVLPIGMTAMGPQSDGYVQTYFPGALSASAAHRIRLQPGDAHGPVEFMLPRVQFLRVSGVVLDPAGQPVPRMAVHLQTSGATGTAGRRTQSTRVDGSFELTGIAPGEYTLNAYRFGGSAREFASVQLPVFEHVDGLVVTLRRAVAVKGRVVFDGAAQEGLSGFMVGAVPGGRGAANAFSIQPNADVGGPSRPGGSREGQGQRHKGQRGAFALSRLRLGRVNWGGGRASTRGPRSRGRGNSSTKKGGEAMVGEVAAVLSALLLSVNGRYVVAILALCVALRWWWDVRREHDVKSRASGGMP